MALKRSSTTQPTAEATPVTTLGTLDTLIPLTFLTPDIRILLVGDTGGGKTTQIGELAEYLRLTTGKNTVMFTMDKGGILPVLPYVELGVIEVIAWDGVLDPWIWIGHAIKGEAKIGGKWVKVVDPARHALAAYEGLTAFSETMLADLSRHSAEHPSQAVGGDSAWSFTATDGDEELKLASNTMSHYGLVQLRIMQEIWKTNPGVPSIWTAILARGQDAYGAILGAQTVGNKQAASSPRWFDLTFRINARPSATGADHTLYLETHTDPQAKGSKVIANSRLPRAGAADAPVDAQITPASIVQAVLQIQKRHAAGKEEIAQRLARFAGR